MADSLDFPKGSDPSSISDSVQESAPNPERHKHWLAKLGDMVPTLLVLAGAGALGWWGHHSGWKVPKFSALLGKMETTEDWCSEHNVPESICVECDDRLLPKGKPKGWCSIHGVPECVIDHPELAQLARSPSITPSDQAMALRSLEFATRAGNNPNCSTHLRRIQFATATDADKAGIRVEPVWRSPAVEYVGAPGELGYDQNRVAHLSSRSPGTIWRVFKHLGQDVKAGEVLALVDAAEVGKAKSELLQAMALFQLKQQTAANLKESGAVVPGARVREADAALVEASIRISAACQALTNLGLPIRVQEIQQLSLDRLEEFLRFLGIPEDTKAQIAGTQTTCLLPLVAPLEGRVMSREVVAGEVVDTARILFEVIDTRSLWLTLDVKGEDAPRVAKGQKVVFTPDGIQGQLEGVISWRNSQADPKTRTVKVRADIPDPQGKWFANTFGTGRIILREEKNAISVPVEALQHDGCCHVVFIRDKSFLTADAKLFHVRKVRVGARDAKTVEISAGVLPGELVVTTGSGLLLTELLRGSLGEGCACHSKK